MREKISVCIIMKNEEQHIGKCLNALNRNGFCDAEKMGEVILVDTGSTDNSITIAKGYPVKIGNYVWKNDFADAKNYAVSLASYKYVMIVDADEYLVSFDEESLNEFFENSNDAIGQVERNNFIMADGMTSVQRDWTERLFNRELYHFEGRIHEQVVPVLPERDIRYVKIAMSFDHDGYLMDEKALKAKAERNRNILLEEYEAGKKDAYTCFQLAQSYLLERNSALALDWFRKAVAFDLNPRAEYAQMIVTGYGQCLLDTDQNEEALGLAGIYDELSFCPDYVFLMGQIYMNNGLYMEAYKEFVKCLTMNKAEARSVGVTDIYPYHNLGVINEIMGEKEGAVQFYEKAAALGYERSQWRLDELKK